MTLRLELDEDLARLLEAEAQTLHISTPQLALQKLRAPLETQAANGENGGAPEHLDDAAFDVLARGVVRDYREVLERLA